MKSGSLSGSDRRKKANQSSGGPRFESGRVHKSIYVDENSFWVRTNGFESFLVQFEHFAYSISAYKIKKMMKVLSKARKERFQRSPSKCEGIERTFTEEELRVFFKTLPNEKYRILFLIQMALSLRISEIAPLNINQINFHRRTMGIFEPKTGRTIEKPLPVAVWKHLSAYIDAHRKHIEAHEGYLWYSKGANGKKHEKPHNTVDYLRKVFRKARRKAGLNTTYGRSTTGKPLYVLGTHSFRRTGTSKMAEALNGNIFELKAYTGHKSTRSLERYVFVDKEKVRRKADDVFR